MSTVRMTHLWLTAFKSFRDADMPLEPLNVLIGRNGAGKSNALDALEVFARLAKGEEVRDALEGNRRQEGPVRGGVEGCAPNGSDEFAIGAAVGDDDGFYAELDVRVQVRPRIQIVHERLAAYIDGKLYELLRTEGPDPNSSDLRAAVWNGRRGRNPVHAFRSSHLLTTQLPLRFVGKDERERQLLDVVQRTLGVLGGVFHLDPVPHLMRQYVPEQDYELRRTAENLSAAVARLKRDDRDRFEQLVDIVRNLPEREVRDLLVGKGSFGDVMLALKEGRDRASVPARQMSDGMLRMVAIATALLSGGGGLDLDHSGLMDAASPTLMLVIEELENGLHPSQAARLLELVKQSSAERQFQVVLTTHSPALLNALGGDDHPGVIVIDRDPTTGLSRARRLVDVPGYLTTMARERLGDAVTRDVFTGRTAPKVVEDLDSILGIATHG